MNNSVCISVRLRANDVLKIKSIARRLGVSDSDLFRYGIRLALSRMLPLLDSNACGVRVLPLFLENDADLIRQFDMDVAQLEKVINSDCDHDMRVEADDLNLLTLHSAPCDYLRVRVQELTGAAVMNATVWDDLRGYLYRKYRIDRTLHAGDDVSTADTNRSLDHYSTQ